MKILKNRTVEGVLVAGLVLLVTLMTFYRVTTTKWSLDAGDAPVWQAKLAKECLAEKAYSSVNPWMGMGTIGPVLIGDWQALAYMYLPASKVDEAMMAFSVFLTTLFMYLFLRSRGFGFWAALFGGIAMGFSTSLLSMARAGHLGKMAGVAYMCGSLFLMELGIRRGWILASAFAGLLAGYGLAWGRDTSLLVGMGLGVFWIKDLVSVSIKRDKFNIKGAAGLVIAGVVAAVAALPMTVVFMPHVGKEAAAEMSEAQGYEWATQWSLPSDELVKLICPSYCGWDSWDEKAPYWGRMGRSAGWTPAINQGFRNFTQTNEYLGLITVILAFVAIAVRITRRGKPAAGAPSDEFFWAGLAFVALLLAMGKYVPLYRIFYELPAMASIRNPVKFMHLVSICLAVLAAHGVESIAEALAAADAERKRVLRTAAIVAGVFAAILLFALISVPGSAAFTTQLQSEGFAQQVQGIKDAMVSGLAMCLFWSVALAALCMVVSSVFFSGSPRARIVVPCLLVMMLGADLLVTNRKYVKYQEWSSMYQSNCVVDYLKPNIGYRVKFIPQNWGLFNYWNSLHVPYFNLRSSDAPAMSRMQKEMAAFYDTVGKDPARLWQLLGVRNIVVPKQMEGQIKGALGDKVRVAKSFDFIQGPGGQPWPQWVDKPAKAGFLIMEYGDAFPSTRWFGDAKRMKFEEGLNLLADPSFDVTKTLIVNAEGPAEEAASSADDGTAQMLSYSGTRIKVRTVSSKSGWLMINDSYDPNWKAEIDDGKPLDVVRADGLFYAVNVPAGSHEITFQYRGSDSTFWVPIWCAGVLAAFLAASILFGLVRRNLSAKP